VCSDKTKRLGLSGNLFEAASPVDGTTFDLSYAERIIMGRGTDGHDGKTKRASSSPQKRELEDSYLVPRQPSIVPQESCKIYDVRSSGGTIWLVFDAYNCPAQGSIMHRQAGAAGPKAPLASVQHRNKKAGLPDPPPSPSGTERIDIALGKPKPDLQGPSGSRLVHHQASFLNGHVMRVAMIIFADGLSAYIQKELMHKLQKRKKSQSAARTKMWLTQCRKSVDGVLADAIKPAGRWDALIIALLMREHIFCQGEMVMQDVDCILTFLNGRIGSSHCRDTSESDVLTVLESMLAVVSKCIPKSSAEDNLTFLLCRVTEIVQETTVHRGTIVTQLCPRDYKHQEFFVALRQWCSQMSAAIGQPMSFGADTIMFDAELEPWWCDVFTVCKVQLRIVAESRFRYLHDVEGQLAIDFEGAYEAMHTIALCIGKHLPSAENVPWQAPSPPTVNNDKVTLYVCGTRSSPRGVDESTVDVVARRVYDDIAKVVEGTGCRALVCGAPGSGKSTALRAVSATESFKSLNRLHIDGSSDARFQIDVVRAVANFQPHSVAGHPYSVSTAFACAQKVLKASHTSVLFVDNATPKTDSLWQLVESSGKCRFIVATSHSDTIMGDERGSHFAGRVFDIGPLSTEESTKMLTQRITTVTTVAPVPGQHHVDSCIDVKPEIDRDVGAPAPAPALAAGACSRIPNTCAVDTSTPIVRDFIRSTLANNASAVTLWGHMIKVEPTILTMSSAMDVYRTRSSTDAPDAVARNRPQDAAYIAAAASVSSALECLDSLDLPKDDHFRVLAVLSSVAMTDRMQTPLALLHGFIADTCSLNDSATPCGTADHAVFQEESELLRARDVCLWLGLLALPVQGSNSVGTMDLNVQRLLQRVLPAGPNGPALVSGVRRMLDEGFVCNYSTTKIDAEKLLAVVPCVRSWCSFALGTLADSKPAADPTKTWERGSLIDTELLRRIGIVLIAVEQARQAEPLFRKCLIQRRQLLMPDDPNIAAAAFDLARTHGLLGRFEDALKLHTETLNFQKSAEGVDKEAIKRSEDAIDTMKSSVLAKKKLPQQAGAAIDDAGAAAAALDGVDGAVSVVGENSCSSSQAHDDDMGLIARGEASDTQQKCPEAARAANESEPAHPCPCCLVNEDDMGTSGMCPACGALFCGDCNKPEKLGKVNCPMCRAELPTLTAKEIVEALEHLLKTREAGRHSGPAYHLLGDMYAKGKGTPQDLKKAAELFKKATKHGSMEAAITLGVCFERGTGVNQDKAKAVWYYRSAAMQGHRKAQYNLGTCYYSGIGVAQDRTVAFLWFKQAAKGYPEAEQCVAASLERGSGVDQDYTEAIKWFHHAAEHGVVAAQNSLGNAYLNGLGTKQNKAVAAKFFEQAADKGHIHATYHLGTLLAKGYDGVRADQKRAVKMFEVAGKEGHAAALFHLAACYGTGRGIVQDFQKAEDFFEQAANKGYIPAKKYLAMIRGATAGAKAAKAAEAPASRSTATA